ncbi:MAG: Nif3-like dinuclear metal center hexameric protein [Desulfatibacillaceae bacterium]|nr:Nif3-like dinuclear metal center hexameric protein [Desulfatibacillaceae bacterium]
MPSTVADILAVMERIAPKANAEPWDSVGLAVGHPDWPVKKIWVALDPLEEVLEEAARQGANLLITHHPLFFTPVQSLNLASTLGRIVEMAITKKIAIFCAHTNLDKARQGVNTALAEALGLGQCQILAPDAACEASEEAKISGMGLVGELPGQTTLADFAQKVKTALAADCVRMVGDKDAPVRRVAVCGGSGSSLLPKFFESGAHVFVTGDIRYHDALLVLEKGRSILDAGHFSTELTVVKPLARLLGQELAKTWPEVTVCAHDKQKDPFCAV